MKIKENILKSGPFKGKRIEWAPTKSVDALKDISEDFMLKIFNMKPGTYLITDESSLSDFDFKEAKIIKKIKKIYDIDVSLSDFNYGNLSKIFERIHKNVNSFTSVLSRRIVNKYGWPSWSSYEKEQEVVKKMIKDSLKDTNEKVVSQ